MLKQIFDAKSSKNTVFDEKSNGVNCLAALSYQTTWANFMRAGMTDTANQIYQVGSLSKTEVLDGYLAHTLGQFVEPVINDCNRRMKTFLNHLGVTDEELFPFLVSLLLYLVWQMHMRTTSHVQWQ